MDFLGNALFILCVEARQLNDPQQLNAAQRLFDALVVAMSFDLGARRFGALLPQASESSFCRF